MRRLANLTALVIVSTGLMIPHYASAKSKGKRFKKQCSGMFNGAANLSDIAGNELFYIPLQIEVDRRGKITGQALRQYFPSDFAGSSESVETVVGKVRKAKEGATGIINCKVKMTSSDGTLFKLQIIRSKGAVGTLSSFGSAVNGAFRGDASLTGSK